MEAMTQKVRKKKDLVPGAKRRQGVLMSTKTVTKRLRRRRRMKTSLSKLLTGMVTMRNLKTLNR
jgi:hypothetical protein